MENQQDSRRVNIRGFQGAEHGLREVGHGKRVCQEKSKCSPRIPDTRGVPRCPEGEYEEKNGVRGCSVALHAVRRSCEQSTQCRR
jgi:hypothetical protein